MVRGLYTAYTGMLNQQQRLDVTTNNLANANTVGFKKEGSTSQQFDECLAFRINDSTTNYLDQKIGKMTLGVKIGETYTDYSQGNFRETGEDFDLAIAGDGFFNISYTRKNGETGVYYTRDGSFTMTKDGNIVTKDGDYLLGESGAPIVVPTDAKITIDAEGNIYNGDELIDRVKITDFEDYNYLEKFGENMYKNKGGAEKDFEGTVNQGYLEMSNVNVVSEMVDMITIQRAYEAAQKVETSMDSLLEQTVTLGRL